MKQHKAYIGIGCARVPNVIREVDLNIRECSFERLHQPLENNSGLGMNKYAATKFGSAVIRGSLLNKVSSHTRNCYTHVHTLRHLVKEVFPLYLSYFERIFERLLQFCFMLQILADQQGYVTKRDATVTRSNDGSLTVPNLPRIALYTRDSINPKGHSGFILQVELLLTSPKWR